MQTQMMSNAGEPKRTLIEAAKRVWGLGGVKAYYRGLSVSVVLHRALVGPTLSQIGLLGVFPFVRL